MPDVADQLRRYGEAVQDLVPTTLGTHRRRRSRKPAFVVGAVAAVVVLAAIGVRSLGDGEGSELRTQPAGPAGDDRGSALSGWTTVAPAPMAGRVESSMVASDDELIIWGGWDGRGLFADGAAWSVAEQRWRALPPSPLGPRAGAVAVWTGEEVLIWGGYGNASPSHLLDGAAYNPATDEWRHLDGGVGAIRGRTAAAWTGTELVLSGVLAPPGASLSSDTFAIDLNGNIQPTEPLPDLPADRRGAGAVWTGEEVLVVSVTDGESVVVDRLDPVTGRWGDRITTSAPGLDTDPEAIAWIQDRLVIAGHYAPGAIVDPAIGTVDALDPSGSDVRFPAVGLDTGVWVGDRFLDLATRRWISIGEPPGRRREFPATVAHAGVAYAWGGDACGPAASCVELVDPEVGLAWAPHLEPRVAPDDTLPR